MRVVAPVSSLNAVVCSSVGSASTTRTVRLTSVARFGGVRLEVNHSASSAVRTPVRPLVVRAEESVTGKVQDAVGSAADKVKDTASNVKGKVQNAAGEVGDFVSGKSEELKDTAKDVSRDVQNKAERTGDKAADAGKDLERNVKGSTSDARGEADNLAVSSLSISFIAMRFSCQGQTAELIPH